jgi:hypothetical protein
VSPRGEDEEDLGTGKGQEPDLMILLQIFSIFSLLGMLYLESTELDHEIVDEEREENVEEAWDENEHPRVWNHLLRPRVNVGEEVRGEEVGEVDCRVEKDD